MVCIQKLDQCHNRHLAAWLAHTCGSPVPKEFPASDVVYPVLPVAERLTYVVHMTVIPVLEPDLSIRVVTAGTVRIRCCHISFDEDNGI